MRMVPEDASMKRKNDKAKAVKKELVNWRMIGLLSDHSLDFPLPVLNVKVISCLQTLTEKFTHLPTIPTRSPALTLKETPFKTGPNSGAYAQVSPSTSMPASREGQ